MFPPRKYTRIGLALQQLLLIVLLLSACKILSQNETNHWHFGENAGLDFSSGDFAVSPDDMMETPAGCSSISDKDGDLLFYTNGENVWNRNHELMTNGIGLITDTSGAQGVAIIPNPENENLYYIFHTRQNAVGGSQMIFPGLYLSIVSFADDPLGIVQDKNIRIRNLISSRLASTYDYSSNTFKLITLGPQSDNVTDPINIFSIFTINGEGPQLAAQTVTLDFEIREEGQMKISPDNKKFAVAESGERWIYLFDLDIATGDIILDKQINPDSFGVEMKPYGLEFSQDSQHLYFTAANSIKRFDIYPTTDDTIIAELAAGGNVGSLQLARNGKIYTALYANGLRGRSTMGVINFPERLANQIEYESTLDVTPGRSIQGLPNIPAALLRNRIVTDYKCLGEPNSFIIDAFRDVASVAWDFGDGTISTALNPNHSFLTAGIHKVKATILGRNDYPVTLYKDVYVYPVPLLDDSIIMKQCDPDNNGTEVFNLYNIIEKIDDKDTHYTFAFYESEAQAQTDTNPIVNPGNYQNTSNPQRVFIKIVSEFGCITISSFSLEAVFKPLAHLNDFVVCEDSDGIEEDMNGLFNIGNRKTEIINQLGLPASSIVTYYPSFLDALTKTNEISNEVTNIITGTSNEIISPSVQIWVRVDDQSYDCNGIGTLNLIVNPAIEIDLLGKYSLCNSGVVNLDGGTTNTSWQWVKLPEETVISVQREVAITTVGWYQLTTSRLMNGITCSDSWQFLVVEAGIVTFSEVSAQNGRINVRVSGASDYQFSLDNLNFYGNGTEYTFENVQPGIYTVYVKDKLDCEVPISAQILLINFDPFFTPNGDGYNDVWKVRNVEEYYSEIKIDIYNRYGSLLYSMQNNEGWNGMLDGKPLPATDYWFKATLTNTQNISLTTKGHFSLKR